MPVHATLQRAFEIRADGVQADGAALVGIFGGGVPLPLVAALGGRAVDIKAPPLSDATEGPVALSVSAVAEPFLDTFAARFLHRLAAGAFERFATLIFVRDDVAGLAAYQYTLELRRQGRLPGTGPRLHLWNLVRKESAAAAAFNRAELARLETHLAETLGTVPDEDRLDAAIAAETRRSEALRALPAGGPEAFVTRNAYRWTCADAAGAGDADTGGPDGPRIALAGTACDSPVLHELVSEVGRVVADLQDYGRVPPQPTHADDLLREIVLDPLAPRTAPPGRYTSALGEGIAGADLVVASVDTNDDSFGWELPGLRATAKANGARFVDLGFRPFRPDAAWRDMARARIAEALR